MDLVFQNLLQDFRMNASVKGVNGFCWIQKSLREPNHPLVSLLLTSPIDFKNTMSRYYASENLILK
jgi:hypothetical protein